MVESPAPVAPVATARERSEWGFAVGVGNARYENQGDLAGVLGLNVAKRWVTAGVRFTIGDRAPVEDGNPALAVDGNVFDLGVLVGVRGEFRGLQAAVRAGPAAWGLNFGEFEDIKAAFAAQGELFFYPTQTVGFGSIVTYNANDIQDYYIVALALAFGPR